MPKRLVVTSHRPQAGQEISRTFIELGYGVHAVSPANAWPMMSNGERNRAVLDRQPAGLTSCIVNQLAVPALVQLLQEVEPQAIIHAPLHGAPPFASSVEGYQAVVNSTLLWLEAARVACPRAPFIFLSSSQVYGDRANTIDMQDQNNRIDFRADAYVNGLTEAFPIENSNHTVIGAAAVAADVLVQEYGRTHHLPTCCLRLDSLCDPGNMEEDPRDLLSLLSHCSLTGTEFTVHGLRGKQVREIVPARDVAALIECYIQQPQPAEIYNTGTGKAASCSVHEAIQCIEGLTGKPVRQDYKEAAPVGEPYCYYSDPRHIRYHYPRWKISEPWKKTAQRVVEAQKKELGL